MLAVVFRTIDGTLNNLQHPEWGSAGEALIRTVAAEYADGISTPAGADRPSARVISNELVNEVEELFSDRNLSAFAYAWGQFIDHDMDLTTSAQPSEPFPVAVPVGDEFFDPLGQGGKTISLNRSNYDPATGTTSPRQQINDITAFIDGSMIYGSDPARALALRTMSGGRLKTSEGNLMPYNTAGMPNDSGGAPIPADEMYLAGDIRANENIELSAVHTLFVREHNRWADRFARAHASWSDERIYQEARRMVIAELQAITYNEFLPALLGPNALSRYRGYDASVDPGIANEFSTAAFRLGHSMLGSDVEFLDNFGEEVHEEVELREAFFNPELVKETNIGSILKYLASDPSREIDNIINGEVRNFLFGPPGAGGFDLASLNIQRGREHGLADYNATRVAYGLKPVQDFDDITSDVEVQATLRELYGNVNNIDLWVGGLAEDHVRGGSLGPTFRAIVSDQFERLRDGDRFWYERDLSRSERSLVNSTSLADVIRRNTDIWNLQENVFYFHTSISGRVQIDLNRDGRISSRDPGMPGITVRLEDLDGNVVATAVTGWDGRYTFEDVDFGEYRVRIELPEYLRQMTRDPRDVAITRSQDVGSVNFGVYYARRRGLTAELDDAEPAFKAAAVDRVLASKLDLSLEKGFA